ncbi:HAMP domain-containing protein [Magnetovirga frankeli]|nr:HAMP domain-containing protein [gamma proteobacterium SS-5]
MIALVMAPMARRASEDLAGLMLLAAQTYSELPPETRLDFQIELAATHQLRLRSRLPEIHESGWHGIYIQALTKALAEKTGAPRPLIQSLEQGEAWFWTALPSGEASLVVGFPASRVGTHPLQMLVFSLVNGLLLAGLIALLLARRITRPLARLEQALNRVGQGETPELLAESGPRELATLARHFNQMARQVQELLSARTTLLAGISHDLRTPLARLRLALALLAQRPQAQLIERMEQDVEAMDRLIADVLDLARGLASEEAQTLELCALLREISAQYAPQRLQLDCPQQVMDIGLNLRPQALRRVLSNLIDNALRYAAEGPVQLVLEQTQGQVRIGVLDQGPGIPEDQLQAVFRPFHRVEASRSPDTGGSGLGLAIVQQLALANGWRIALHNRPGGGLAVWLELL